MPEETNHPTKNSQAVATSALFSALWKSANGALKCALDAHGPITLENYGSAGKRVASQIYVLVAQRIEHGDSTSDHAGSTPAEDAKMSVPADANYDAYVSERGGNPSRGGGGRLSALND